MILAVGIVSLLIVAGLAVGFWKKFSAVSPGRAALLDPSFKTGSGADNEVRSFAIQPDGKILVGGKFTQFNGESRDGIARLNVNGTLDAAFAPDVRGAVHAIAVEPDGHILIGGDFGNVGGASHRRIARLEANGQPDPAFIGGGNADIRAIALESGGTTIIGGSFVGFNGAKNGRITRIGTRGTHAGGFQIGAGANAIVWSIALQPDGKIIAGGGFTQFDNEEAGRIVRLNSDGSRDSAFKPGSGADAAILAVAVQDNGKILAAGDFISFNETVQNHIVRLNADGSVDKSFNPGMGPNSGIRSLAVQRDGKIIIGGGFTSVEGVVCNHIARLNADGSLDRSFDASGGASGAIWRVAIQKDGKILAGGLFKSFNGADCGNLVRLLGDSE